jgi:hypothetical protein
MQKYFDGKALRKGAKEKAEESGVCQSTESHYNPKVDGDGDVQQQHMIGHIR